MNHLLKTIYQNKKALFGVFSLSLVSLITLLGPLFVNDPSAFVAQPHLAPCLNHPFGTTGQGQDVLAQTISGARPTLLIGFSVGLLVTALGGLIGVSSGFIGGRWDEFISVIINVFLVIPGLPLAIILAAYLPPGPFTLILVLTLTGWAWTARVLRSQTLSLCQRDFIKASLVIGESRWRIVLLELMPHMASLLLSTFIGTTIYAIGAQVGLEFLGLGDVSAVTWGTNLYWASNDQALLTQAWWTYTFTGLGIAFVGFALAMINFGIDEVTNPKLAVERVWRTQLKQRGLKPSNNTPRIYHHE